MALRIRRVSRVANASLQVPRQQVQRRLLQPDQSRIQAPLAPMLAHTLLFITLMSLLPAQRLCRLCRLSRLCATPPS